MWTTLVLTLLMTSGASLEDVRGGEFRAPIEHELRRSRELFRRTLESADPAPLRSAWREIGFELSPVSGRERIWALRETPERREGRGFYLFRGGPARAVALQAPHGVESDDMLTGDIALRLFDRHGARAGAWSTLPRESIDLAHSSRSAFHEFTRRRPSSSPRSVWRASWTLPWATFRPSPSSEP